MAQNWFYKAKEKEVGPISSGELKEKAEQGLVMLTTLVRRESDENWAEARLVKGLFPPAIAEAAAKAAKAREAAEKEDAEQAANEPAAAEPAPNESAPSEPETNVNTPSETEDSDPLEAAAEDNEDLLPEEHEPITLPALAPESLETESLETESLEPEPLDDVRAGEPLPAAASKPGKKLSPLLLGGVGGGVALLLVVGIVAWLFLGGKGEDPAPVPEPTPQLSAAEQQLNTVAVQLNNERYDQAGEILAGLIEQELSASERKRAESLAAELQEFLDTDAAEATLEQLEKDLTQKNFEAVLVGIETYLGNPQGSEEEKSRLILLGEELRQASSQEDAQAALVDLNDEQLRDIEQRQWEPEIPYENSIASELAASTMAEAAKEERARRQQLLEAAAAAEAAAKRHSREEYLAFRHQYDDYMLQIAALRIGDIQGEPTSQRWAFLEGLPRQVQGDLEGSRSFAGRKQILGFAEGCQSYLLQRERTVAQQQLAVQDLHAAVLQSGQAYAEGSLAHGVFENLAAVLVTQEEVLQAEAVLCGEKLEEIEFEYAVADRHNAPAFVDQLVAGMLDLRSGLSRVRAPQKSLKFDVWKTVTSDYPAEWEEEYQLQFLAENTAAIEQYLLGQSARFENVAGLLGHWRRQTKEGEEGLGLDVYIQQVDLATYLPPPAASSWETAAQLRPGASYLVLEMPSDGAVSARPTPDQVAALSPKGEQPTGFPYSYLVSGSEDDAPHRLRALHVTAMRTVAPQGKLEGWCVIDDEGRLFCFTGSRSGWTSPPLVSAFGQPAGSDSLVAATCTQEGGLQLLEGVVSFADSPGWSGAPGLTVVSGRYDFIGDDRPNWATEFQDPLERPAEEHPFVNQAWQNTTAAVEIEGAETASDEAEATGSE